ncbi:MAG: hypothetical protein RJB01_1745 [Actinomycetota bacterium]|jgi:peptidyl-prolyl cis-trans isomerase B (cyclophilin B)
MATRKRERELARAKYERQQQRRSQAQASARHRQRIIGATVAGIVVAAVAVWAGFTFLGSEETIVAAESPAPAASGTTETADISLDCTTPGTSRENTMSWPSAPETEAAGGTLTFTTNCGPIAIELLPEAAPKTVASEIFLTAEGFYDATTCHRLTTSGIYVLQCGDPAGDGTGGPGYSVPDENLPTTEGVNYPAGTVAMANAGPGTSGSQFFLVYEDTTLPPSYTVWGTVTDGLDLIRAIAAQGVADGSSDGQPAQPVFIESATFSPA